MNLEKYAGVIRMVHERNRDKSGADFYDELVKSLEIAQALTGELNDTPAPALAPLAQRTVSVPRQITPVLLPEAAQNKPGPRLLSVAPPVAGYSDADAAGNEPEDDIDYWESKPGKGDGCHKMSNAVQKAMPASITVQIPGIDEPLTLVRGVGSPGIKFVHIHYTLPGDTMGPRFTLMTSQKDINPDAILADILDQAEKMYSKEKRTLVPRATPAPPPPSPQDLQRMLERDRRAQLPNDGVSGDDATKAREEAASWARTRSPQWQ